MRPQNFQEAFCKARKCSPARFEQSLFWRCVYPHAIPLAFLIRIVAPSFFRDDGVFIQHLASDIDLAEVDADIDRFEYGNRIRKHWLRTGLRIRMCGVKAMAVAEELFAPARACS